MAISSPWWTTLGVEKKTIALQINTTYGTKCHQIQVIYIYINYTQWKSKIYFFYQCFFLLIFVDCFPLSLHTVELKICPSFGFFSFFIFFYWLLKYVFYLLRLVMMVSFSSLSINFIICGTFFFRFTTQINYSNPLVVIYRDWFSLIKISKNWNKRCIFLTNCQINADIAVTN